jgi:hypothetical protein
MADCQLSAAPHPLANPGYGKRTVSGQLPRTADDFAHLPKREAAVAAYIDRLDDNSDISVKTLAKFTPYGQWALSKALNHLIRAGHLRRGLEAINSESGSTLWVTRTWWSRTAHDDAWWAAFQRGDVPVEPVEKRRPTRSRAYVLLAALGRANPMMSLSHTECLSLVPLVDEWFARDATERQLLHALTDGLPVPVHHAAALARRRLTDKLPPEPVPLPPPRRILECGTCGVPGRADALVDGACARCRGGGTAPPPTLPAARVHAHAAQARAAANRPPETTRTQP